jgi:hypothetical protein
MDALEQQQQQQQQAKNDTCVYQARTMSTNICFEKLLQTCFLCCGLQPKPLHFQWECGKIMNG